MDMSHLSDDFGGPVEAWIEGEFAGDYPSRHVAETDEDLRAAELERAAPVELYLACEEP